MDSERQADEITALRGIYGDDFSVAEPPKAWRNAERLPDFNIRVTHLDPQFAEKVNFQLNVKLPRSYPTSTVPIFTVQKPAPGLTDQQLSSLRTVIQEEIRDKKGVEIVYDVVECARQWIDANVVPPVEVVGSLAMQMNQRARDAALEKQRQAAEEEAKVQAEAARRAEELEEQIQADAQQKLHVKAQQTRARRRANSEATEVPSSGETPTESFNEEIEFKGVRFNTVKMFHPRREGLGTVYLAEPVCDDINTTLPLELLVYTFESPYYTTPAGRNKLEQVEKEARRLSERRDSHLLSVLAVKFHKPHAAGATQLIILTEQRPALSLQDVLEDCQCLRDDRASTYLGQILSALNVLHAHNLVHRGINTRCIGITSQNDLNRPKLVKLGRCVFHTHLLDLHKSNPFGSKLSLPSDETRIPDGWLFKDPKNDSSLVYTRQRDIHAVGVVLIQMLVGHDVMDVYPTPQAALLSNQLISPALRDLAQLMVLPGKKIPTCLSLLGDLASMSFHSVPARSPTIPFHVPKTPMATGNLSSSPEIDYFWMPSPSRQQVSRWKNDFEELELLGRGAFGSVVKARNKHDSKIYAVKKVRLRTSDSKIYREVHALSQLNHPFIVRYYGTWVETSTAVSRTVSDDGTTDTESGTEDGRMTDSFSFSLSDLDLRPQVSQSSFPSIHFTAASDRGTDYSGSSDEASTGEPERQNGNMNGSIHVNGMSSPRQVPFTPPAADLRTLYIQMEFVERQTLKERVEEGISEDEAWRLFQQIVDALAHMSSHGILHRDIKLTNIFIDLNGNCKVGDFGLATSSLEAVDPSDLSSTLVQHDSDMTLEVGTKLYIAPEIQNRRRGPRHSTRADSYAKADMYSLGIVFFEMNFSFSTGSERIVVIEGLRKEDIVFPTTWQPQRHRQRQIITWLLNHDPRKRPTALELSQSPLMPPRLEEEYFKGALRMMTNRNSPHHQAVLSSLFSEPLEAARNFNYDAEADPPEHASLNGVVQDRLSALFRLHGAVDIEAPLLMPIVKSEDDKTQAIFIDKHGAIVGLPSNLLVPFARLAARTNVRRHKRYHVGDIYRTNPAAEHPKVLKAAIFDIISPDLASGPVAAAAEILVIANNCLSSFPMLSQLYDIHVSHSEIVRIVLGRIPENLRSSVIDILLQSKSSTPQKRALLLKKGLLRSVIDELEVLAAADDEIDDLLFELERVSPSLHDSIQPAVIELKSVIQHANLSGGCRPVVFSPLMLGAHHANFKDGVIVEIARKTKHLDVLAAGGRYDSLIANALPTKPKMEPSCAFAFQVSVDKITLALAAYQSTAVKNLVKEQRSFGYWSPRRCDVYVVSYHADQLQERLETAAYLWQHGISADIMYESGLPGLGNEDHVEVCAREGILFTVYPRPRSARRDQPAYKVKSLLKGTEYDLTKQELVGWLQHQISEQKRVDLSSSGAPLLGDAPPTAAPAKESLVSTDVQLLLPVDTKKQRKTKNMFMDRAFETREAVKAALNTMPMLAVEVTPTVFDAMIRNTSWITDDEPWKHIMADFPPQQSQYAQHIRDQVRQRKAEGHPYVLLFSVKEERVQLLALEKKLE
ncbi:hypothetical protein HGRIS_006101 [Hohenbuehelia grisea]|uniref:non-specific serine/threonine protein kinase n=1 Tax=Hohenbuehelia grisea TaxID=104357 RepID=A0ABR3K1D1_9AGAR